MQKFIESCKNASARSRQMNEETEIQDELDIPTLNLDGAGAFGLSQDQDEAKTCQPLTTSTPKRNTCDPPTPAVNRDSDGQGVSGGGGGPLPEKGTPAWFLREGPEEIAEICLPDVQPYKGDKANAGDRDQEDICSEAGDLVEEGGPASESLPSNNEVMSSLNEVTSSLNWVMDASIVNTESIKKLEEIHRKQCVKANIQQSKSVDENMSLRNDQDATRKILVALTAKVFKLSQQVEALQADKKVDNRGVEALKIPYVDLKRNGIESFSSQTIQTPSGGNFKATLYLNGLKEGAGTHLSLVIQKTSYDTLKYKCKVQVVSLGSGGDSISKEGDFHSGVTVGTSGENLIEFQQFASIELLKDPSPFLVNGVLMVVLTFEET